MATATAATRTRRRKVWAFRLAAVLVGLLPLLLIEIALRLLGLGHPDAHDDPFVGFSAVRPLFVPDATGTRLEIAPSRQIFFRPDSFAARKSPREFRIFCLGGSTVQGRPFAIETSFTTWLEITLNAADPSRSWEVVNCGGVSYASYRLAPIVEELLQYDPDLFIIYSGHNEFLEDRTYAPIKQIPRLIRAPLEWIGSLRTFVLLREGAAWLSRDDGEAGAPRTVLPEEVDTILDYRGGLGSYHRDPRWRAGVIAHYAFNLRRMIAMARGAGVPVILVNPVANLDTPPFKSEHRADLSESDRLRFEALWDEARERYDTDMPGAIARLRAALEIDDQHAGIHYTLAKCLQQRRRFAEAKAEFERARDLDICPLRILGPMNRIVLEIGRETGTPVVDLVPMFEAWSVGGIVGSDWLVDHVHPGIPGHKRIAAALFDRITHMGLVRPREGWRAERDRRYAEHYDTLGDFYFLKAQQRLQRLRLWAAGRGIKLRAPNARREGDAP